MLTKIRVSRDNIEGNRKRKMGEWGIVVTAFYPDGSQKSGMDATWEGASKLVYDGDSCWIETDAIVTIGG